MVTDNTSSQDKVVETQSEAPQNLAPETDVQGDEGVTQDIGNEQITLDGADQGQQTIEDSESNDQRSFSSQEVAKLQSAEHKNQAKLQQEIASMQDKVSQLEAQNKQAEQQQTISMVEANKVAYAEKLTQDYVDQGYDGNQARKMAVRQSNDEATLYVQRLELAQEQKRLEEQRSKNQQENRLTTKHKIASKYGIDANQLDVFTTPEQMENYAKLAGKLVETGNQLTDNSPVHNSAESIAADGTPQNDQSLIQKYLRGDRSDAASGAVKRMMGR